MNTTRHAEIRAANVAKMSSLALGLIMAAGCGSGSNSAGTGGGPGTGGTTPTGSGGQSAMGGQTGSGGQTGTGGQTNAGGRSGTGGAPTTDGGMDGPMGTGGQGALGGGGGRGGRGGGGGATTDGGVAFAPCPPSGTTCVILPLGDSITDGFPAENGGYRVELFHQTLVNSQHVTFVGSLANGPATVDGVTFPTNHEGHSGFTINNEASVGRTGISGALTDTAIANFRPHIILLMIGTNDINLSVNLATAPARLAALMDEIIVDAPNALLVVAQLTPTASAAENVRFQAYNAAIPALVQQRAAAGKHVIMVDMYTAFTANPNYVAAYMVSVADNLHPNATGYALMGDTWYAAIRSFLPVGP